MSAIKGIEHIGITVPSIEEAERFFHAAFDARTLYALIDKDDEPQRGEDMEPKKGLRAGTQIIAMRMLRIAKGANVELFEVTGIDGGTASGPADMGIHHFALYVDDLDAAATKFRAAGGSMRDGPIELGGKEKRPGNRCWFGTTPWGLPVEFIHLPSPLNLDNEAASGPRWLPA